MEFNGNINFLAALLDGLPTPERSERLEVKNDDSSTAQAQNIHRGAASLSANYNLPHRMRSPLNRVHFEWNFKIRVGLNLFWAAMLTLFWGPNV